MFGNSGTWKTDWELGQKWSAPVKTKPAGLVEGTKKKLTDLNLILRADKFLKNSLVSLWGLIPHSPAAG